jgi:hypothetical protein
VIHPEIASEKFLTGEIITFKIYVGIFLHCLLHSALANKTPDLLKKIRIFNKGMHPYRLQIAYQGQILSDTTSILMTFLVGAVSIFLIWEENNLFLLMDALKRLAERDKINSASARVLNITHNG